MRSSDSQIIKIIQRRNSRITFFKRLDGSYVEKKYSSVYSVGDEVDAYSRVGDILNSIEGLRIAEIIGINELENTILLRYIEGLTLSESFAKYGLPTVLSRWSGPILSLFLSAYQFRVHFDSDPGNFILSMDMRTLTVIDPVSHVDELQHGAIVVFLFGLLKHRIRYLYRFHELKEFRGVWRGLIDRYALGADVSAKAIYAELSEYSRMVARWNCQYNKNEGAVMWIFRVMGVSPIWRALGFWFQLLSNPQRAAH